MHDNHSTSLISFFTNHNSKSKQIIKLNQRKRDNGLLADTAHFITKPYLPSGVIVGATALTSPLWPSHVARNLKRGPSPPPAPPDAMPASLSVTTSTYEKSVNAFRVKFSSKTRNTAVLRTWCSLCPTWLNSKAFLRSSYCPAFLAF